MLQYGEIIFSDIGNFSCCQSGGVENIENENDAKNNSALIKIINIIIETSYFGENLFITGSSNNKKAHKQYELFYYVYLFYITYKKS